MRFNLTDRDFYRMSRIDRPLHATASSLPSNPAVQTPVGVEPHSEVPLPGDECKVFFESKSCDSQVATPRQKFIEEWSLTCGVAPQLCVNIWPPYLYVPRRTSSISIRPYQQYGTTLYGPYLRTIGHSRVNPFLVEHHCVPSITAEAKSRPTACTH